MLRAIISNLEVDIRARPTVDLEEIRTTVDIAMSNTLDSLPSIPCERLAALAKSVRIRLLLGPLENP
jgi:hypothetical protein